LTIPKSILSLSKSFSIKDMKTEVCIERPLLNGLIRQSNLTEYLSVNDLLLVANKWRITNNMDIYKYDNWYNSTATKEFLKVLEYQIGKPAIISKRGKTGERWAHPFAFIDLALNINPQLKIEVYTWIYDQLIKYRNDSGDSYKKMCGALYENCSNKSNFHRGVSSTAHLIQKACGVVNWQTATEEQLKLRDKIHDNISLLCDVLRDNNQAIRIGITKAINNKI
jgi:hypothetical protein